MKNSIKAFGQALKDKYGDDTFVKISIGHGWHQEAIGGYRLRYNLYIENVSNDMELTFKELTNLVNEKAKLIDD